MKKLLLILVVCFSVNSYAQNYKFGKVSKEELEEKMHPLDSTADAAILYTKRRTYYDFNKNDGFKIVNQIHVRIKIYNKEGFEKATQKIRYYKPKSGSKEKVGSLSAVTYNLEKGKVKKTKTSKKDIFDVQISKYTSEKKITFPNIKVGSVIELEYRLTSPYERSIDPLKFQYDIPVKKMECSIEIPEYYNFKQQSKGYYGVASENSTGKRSVTWTVAPDRNDFNRSREFENRKVDFDVKIQKYVAENIPALKDNEAFVNNIDNYRGGVQYEINFVKFPNSNPKFYATSWDDVAKSIYKQLSSELQKTSYYKKDLTGFLQGVTDDSKKIVQIFRFVKDRVKWNGYFGKYPDKPLKKAYKEGTGNSASINLMMISMLNEAGLDANPVLVSTKSNGIPIFPTRDGFNYVICAVNMGDGFVLLDASERYSLPNMLPPRTLNFKGRLIEKNGNSRWLNLTLSNKSIEDNFISVKITDDGLVEGMMRNKFQNLGALKYRNKYNRVKEDQLIENLESEYNIEIENYKVANKFDLGKAVTRTIKFSSEDLIEEINGKMYIKPVLFNGYTTNPFKLKERKFPVEFAAPWKEKNSVTIQIPEGYTIESVPEAKALGLPDNLGLFKYQVILQGSKIKVISLLEFNTSVISANYYETLKGFFKEFVDKQSEKIVLVKG